MLPCNGVAPTIESCLRGVVQELNKVRRNTGAYQNLARILRLECQVNVLRVTSHDWQSCHTLQ